MSATELRELPLDERLIEHARRLSHLGGPTFYIRLVAEDCEAAANFIREHKLEQS